MLILGNNQLSVKSLRKKLSQKIAYKKLPAETTPEPPPTDSFPSESGSEYLS